MPGRDEPFVNNEIYHVFNKTIESKSIFDDNKLCALFLELIKYYRSTKSRISYSRLEHLEKDLRHKILDDVLITRYYKIQILCYCLMPTHFHLLVRQISIKGISKFISDIVNSFTRFYNLKNQRKGPIFLPRFKAERIRNNEQLIHVSRYIHINPDSSEIVRTKEELINYDWSSLKEYVFIKADNLSDPAYILNIFNNDREKYKNFIFNNLEYQRTLEMIKHADKWI